MEWNYKSNNESYIRATYQKICLLRAYAELCDKHKEIRNKSWNKLSRIIHKKLYIVGEPHAY
jgi:hypothetical protein